MKTAHNRNVSRSNGRNGAEQAYRP